MKSKIYFLLGIVLLFGAVWGGPYLASKYPDEHWQKFPIVFTSMIAGATGVLLAGWKMGDIIDGK
jgi:hypothetical protein